MKMKNRMTIAVLLLAALGLLLGSIGCGDADDDANQDDNNHEEEETIEEHACEHAQDGPFVPSDGSALTAGVDAEDSPPTIHSEEWATVALHDDGDGTYEGFVIFEAGDDGDHFFFSSDLWPGEEEETEVDPYLLITEEESGDALGFEHKESIGEDPGCVEINFSHLYEGFVAGEHYVIEISGHPEEQISIVPEPAGGDHDHDEHDEHDDHDHDDHDH